MLARRLSPLLLALAGCTAAGSQPQAEPEPSDPWERGGFEVGHATVELEDEARGRSMVIEVWYPATSAEGGSSPASFETEADAIDTIQALLDEAPQGCATQEMGAQRDAPAWDRTSPLVAFSHCLGCGRYSAFSLAEQLASHGMVVVAPDHAGPLPYANGELEEPLDADQLDVRVGDIDFVLDAALDGSLFEAHEALGPIQVDAGAVGMFGHSFGSVTSGAIAQDDPRIKAVAGLAAPMENPLLPGVSMDNIDMPLMFVLAEEDNSIGELGNVLVRDNFESASSPAWRIDIADAGHWSVADVAGLVEPFQPGCGSGERHSMGREGEPFDYIDPALGRGITAQHVTTFFAAQLIGSEVATDRLDDLPNVDGVTVFTR